MTEYVETVIIGGGQAGLALSYYLTRQGRSHLVLEQGRVDEVWRSGHWDSFTLNTLNWMIQLPGFPYQGDQIFLAPDLEENLAGADTFERHITQRIDEYIKQTGMEVEANRSADEAPSNDALSTKPIPTLDLQAAGSARLSGRVATSSTWAGYRHPSLTGWALLCTNAVARHFPGCISWVCYGSPRGSPRCSRV